MTISKPKPSKPYPDFPLTPHPNGQWCKKVRGKVHFFGVWSDPHAALAEYLEIRDDLQAGRVPRSNADQLTVRDLVNRYLTVANRRMEAGEIIARTFTDYRGACGLLVDNFGQATAVEGLGPSDFTSLRYQLVEKYSAGRLNKNITVKRKVFRWGYESDLIDRPVKFGPDFRGESRKSMRIAKATRAAKLFTAEEILTLIGAANQPFKAMTLLAPPVQCHSSSRLGVATPSRMLDAF